MAGEDSTWGLSGGYKAPRVKAGTVVKAPSAYQGSPYAQGQDMFTVAPTKQLATTSQDILAGKGTMQGLSIPIANTEGLVGKTGGWSNVWNGSGFGNGLTPSGAQYAYTDPTTGAQQYADLNAEQLDAIQNPTGGSGMFDGVTAGGVMQGIDIGLKGWDAYNQYKGLGLAKDMFEREKAVTDANFINQQKLINIDRDNSRAVGLALGGGAMTADQIAADTAAYNKTRFSEKGIGA